MRSSSRETPSKNLYLIKAQFILFEKLIILLKDNLLFFNYLCFIYVSRIF